MCPHQIESLHCLLICPWYSQEAQVWSQSLIPHPVTQTRSPNFAPTFICTILALSIPSIKAPPWYILMAFVPLPLACEHISIFFCIFTLRSYYIHYMVFMSRFRSCNVVEFRLMMVTEIGLGWWLFNVDRDGKVSPLQTRFRIPSIGSLQYEENHLNDLPSWTIDYHSLHAKHFFFIHKK